MQRLVLGWLVLSISASAAAQGTATSESVAEAPAVETTAPELDQAARLLFEAGSRAYAAGRFAEALMRYQNAYRLSQRPQLLYNIAVCNDRLDHKEDAADAYEMFLDVLPTSPSAPIARARLEVLRTSLARATTHDDASDAGESDGSADHETAADQAGVDGAADAEQEQEQEQEQDVPPPTTEPDARSLAGPLVALGVGAAGLVTFGVAGLMSRSRYDDCKDGGCSASQLDDVDRSALFADIGLGVAVVGTTVGVVLLLVGREDDAGEHARVTPAVGPHSAGLIYQGRF